MTASRETIAAAEFGDGLIRQAAIEGVHPTIFLSRVAAHVVVHTWRRAGSTAALAMLVALIGVAGDLIDRIKTELVGGPAK